MRIQQQIQQKLTTAMVEKDEDTKSTLRFILGEFSRCREKEIPDLLAIKIVRKAIEDEQSINGSQQFINILKQFIPTPVTKEEVLVWIQDNIDFSLFRNKPQAMQPIMAHFAGRISGSTVKEIIEAL